ncbi:MAG: mechanosensitive ion channel [Legionellaceae bacterium]|nr:mechanosensitive ion channel [Legionellaceae bacterium]
MRAISLFLLFLYSLLTFANPNVVVVNPLADSKPSFDVKAANTKFDRVNLKLSTQGIEAKNLNEAIKNLRSLMGNADECLRVNEKKLSNIDSQIQEAKPSGENIDVVTKNSKSSADLIYLNAERTKLTSQISQCRLFSIRAKEAIEVYENILNKIKKEEIVARSKPIWEMFSEISNTKIVQANIPLSIFNIPPEVLYPSHLGMMFSFSLLLAGLIFFKVYNSKRMRQHIHLKKVYFPSFILLTLSLMSLSITAYLEFISYQQHSVSELLIYLSSIISIYLCGCFLIVSLFNIKRVKALFSWYSFDSTFFKLLSMIVLSLYGISVTAKLLSTELNINELVWRFEQSLFLYLELLLAIGFVYYFCRTHRQIPFVKKQKALIQSVCSLMFIACGILNALGYHSLSMHLTFSGIITFAIIFATILLEQAISKLYNLCVIEGPARSKMIAIFGYRPGQVMTEILILKTTLQIIILMYAAYLVSKSWGYANHQIESAFSSLINGIQFETFTFHPTRLISGVIVFCVLYLLFKSISTAISRHEQFDGEEETQVAIASILTYVGFAVSIISAFLVSGFDFTGLAIVAGALSVGIGLGLQSIVNNFVSGIILLIEKPIKPGDRINVDGIEGFVKKIRVRSTQILTPTREDMIIPNSDLITHRVTNYMYTDKHLTIFCEVGIGYGSDISLARELLIDIANKHSEIMTSVKNNKPRVFIRSFGENSMLFQLWFMVRDGNKKVLVKSELYFEIERVFRENNIVIACPKRDINIKMTDIDSLKSDK